MRGLRIRGLSFMQERAERFDRVRKQAGSPERDGEETIWRISAEGSGATLTVAAPPVTTPGPERLWRRRVRPGPEGFVQIGDLRLAAVREEGARETPVPGGIRRWNRSPLRAPDPADPEDLERAFRRMAEGCAAETRAIESIIQEDRQNAEREAERTNRQQRLFGQISSGAWPGGKQGWHSAPVTAADGAARGS